MDAEYKVCDFHRDCMARNVFLGMTGNLWQVPEMSRVALAELVLQIHLLELGNAEEFLQTVIEPPPERSVVAAVNQLQAAGALTHANTLTPLGAPFPPIKMAECEDAIFPAGCQ